jgi:hypothetical protein
LGVWGDFLNRSRAFANSRFSLRDLSSVSPRTGWLPGISLTWRSASWLVSRFGTAQNNARAESTPTFMIDTVDFYYDSGDREDFNRQAAQWFSENPTARELSQLHVMVDVQQGKMKGTIKFEINER